MFAFTTLKSNTHLSQIKDNEEKNKEYNGKNSANNLNYHLSDPVLFGEVNVGQNDKSSEETEKESEGKVLSKDPEQALSGCKHKSNC